MVVTGTAVTLIVITLLSLAAITAASVYILPPYFQPAEDDGHHS